MYIRSPDRLEREFCAKAMVSKIRPLLSPRISSMFFEIVSPSRRSYILQAENQREFLMWTKILDNQVKLMLTAKSPKPRISTRVSNSDVRMKLFNKKQEILKKNPRCADCGAANPDWVNIMLGSLVCIECSGIHRSLGTHVSKIRSVVLDNLKEATLECILLLSNETVNQIIEKIDSRGL
eukprot:TRINITY_DN2910_c0_g1_i1.p1 TRINITY_DN2910_c0_g1~~TRINITY_DN2910_c0_g1_i1.p1  ORF type:complete len:180 (+),score=7.37 TRINITY_DN2910_c0_g1_i1:3-542(+)